LAWFALRLSGRLPLASSKTARSWHGNRVALAPPASTTNTKTEYDAVLQWPLPDITDRARFPAGRQAQAGATAANPNPPECAWESMAPATRRVITGI